MGGNSDSVNHAPRDGMGVHTPRVVGSERAPNMLLLTGPNYSGKSVYMKQVGNIIEGGAAKS